MIDKRSTKAYKLDKENKRLIELCNKYEEEHKTAFKLWTMKMEEIPTYEEKIEMQNEIKRLNNIINKFEKWLDTVPNYFMDTRSNNTGVYIQKGMQQMIDMSKNKLQELKGSDKE